MTRHNAIPVSLVAFGHFVLETCSNFLPVVYPLLIPVMGLTYAQIGLLALVLGVGASAAQPIFGLWSDRWSAWKIAPLGVAWIGLFLGAVGLLTSYYWLVLVVAVGALGAAAFHPAGATIAYAGGGRRRGVAVSIFSVGGNLGAAFSPLAISMVIGKFGLAGTTVLIPAALGSGLLIYRRLGTIARREAPVAQDAPAQPARDAPAGWLVGLSLIVVAMMARSWFQVGLVTYLPTWVQAHGYGITLGGQMLFAFLVSVGAGSLTGGALSDYIGRWSVLTLGLGLLGPAYWVYLNASTIAGLTTLLIVMGVLIGFTFPVSIVLAQDIWPRRVGLASALVMGLGWAPGGMGASVTGLLADVVSLDYGLRWLIIAPMVGLAALLTFGVLRRRGAQAIVQTHI